MERNTMCIGYFWFNMIILISNIAQYYTDVNSSQTDV